MAAADLAVQLIQVTIDVLQLPAAVAPVQQSGSSGAGSSGIAADRDTAMTTEERQQPMTMTLQRAAATIATLST